MMPQLLQQMQNPSVQQLMSNPEALQAIMQIQQGMERLRVAAPDVYNSMGLPSLPPGFPNLGTLPTSGSTSTPTPAPGTASPAPGSGPLPQADVFSQFMTQVCKLYQRNAPTFKNLTSLWYLFLHHRSRVHKYLAEFQSYPF